MKVSYRLAARDDAVRQFRYYLITLNLPETAVRFRDCLRRTIQSLCRNPELGSRYLSGEQRLRNLRSWPIVGFEAVRVYYLVDEDTIHVIRILHGKRDIRAILEGEPSL